MTHHVRSVRLSTGVTLQYVAQGNVTGVPVVMLHGVTDSWRSFERVLPHLPPTVRAFAITQRGHGDADHPPTGYHASDFANDVAAFMDAMDLDAAIVVGHSMGGTNAIRLALDHAARVSGLVLVGAFASFRRSEAAVEFHQTTVRGLTDPVDPAFAREFQESTLARPIPPAYLERVVGETLKVPAHVWREAFSAMLDDECTAELSALQVPVLIVSGGRDVFSDRANQAMLAATIPQSRHIEYGETGHALHWEAPADFAVDLLAFVESLEGRQSVPAALRHLQRPSA